MLQKILVVVVCCSIATAEQAHFSCTTPNRKAGACIRIHDCQKFLDVIKTKPLSHEDVLILRNHQCGITWDKVPKVCCPLHVESTSDVNLIPMLDTKDLFDMDNCGSHYRSGLIPGNYTNLDDYPWTALLQYTNSNTTKFSCTGVLINKNYVLTAAHCVSGSNALNNVTLSVRLGEHNINTETDCDSDYGDLKICAEQPQNYEVEKIIVHENYSKEDINQHHNIALLKLQESVNYTDFIKPICLPIAHDDFKQVDEEYRVLLTGWGNYYSISGIKFQYFATLNETSNDVCATKYKKRNIIIVGKNQICIADDLHQFPCTFNGSIPLAVYNNKESRFVLNGIQSFGTDCERLTRSMVYTRINRDYMMWILSNMDP